MGSVVELTPTYSRNASSILLDLMSQLSGRGSWTHGGLHPTPPSRLRRPRPPCRSVSSLVKWLRRAFLTALSHCARLIALSPRTSRVADDRCCVRLFSADGCALPSTLTEPIGGYRSPESCTGSVECWGDRKPKSRLTITDF